MTQSDIAISAQGLGKSYKIGHRSAAGRSETLRDAMVKGVSNFARKTGDVLRGRPLIAGDTIEEFWALKDVSFEVKRGEAVGIIGHNGAGKSTLLKVLSRITEPTAGQVRIAGRIASLLEVGTGFHPELSGRENIYLNGAVLGMTRAEINRKFDEIVDFAGVEKFLDTPVKRYSSGMYVRLAFSVAAHLEPEILVVDEVLAVGDTAFQQKCLGKMQDVAGQGRTVLFVSHNLAAVERLCERGIVLKSGSVEFIGPVLNATEHYVREISSVESSTVSSDLFSARCEVFDANGAKTNAIKSGKSARIRVSIEQKENVRQSVHVAVGIRNELGALITVLDTEYTNTPIDLVGGGGYVDFELPRANLSSGRYELSLRINNGLDILLRASQIAFLSVESSDFYASDGKYPDHLQVALSEFSVKTDATFAK